MQFENLVDGLIEGAADSFNFTDNSFLPDQARSALDGFVGADVSEINISGKCLHGDIIKCSEILIYTEYKDSLGLHIWLLIPYYLEQNK